MGALVLCIFLLGIGLIVLCRRVEKLEDIERDRRAKK